MCFAAACLQSFVRSEPQALWPAQEDAEVDLSPGPTPAAGTHKSSSWDGTDTARMDSRMSADSGSVTRLSLTSECAMDVSVVSVCERYLRVWLERIPPRGGAAGAAGSAPATASSPSTEGPTPSDNVVLPPGEASVLHCGSPLIVPAESSAECVRPLCHEPDRMAAAEVLCDTWAIAWRMIGVGEDEDRAPHGLVQLAAVDVARVSLSTADDAFIGQHCLLRVYTSAVACHCWHIASSLVLLFIYPLAAEP